MPSKKSAHLQVFGIFDLTKLKKNAHKLFFLAQGIIQFVYKYHSVVATSKKENNHRPV